ncbi:hypothetical protein ZHAS_00015998 [Anopheles sinensis]|uniref:Uncharacterized protein n=1 Tax=Anopheles sinensis TaxID=74873 RepID=A0A084WCJ2_ANOSI|nr:hypothetical protein ZHAS_00015998 [Anopheles sinensis]
MEEERSWKQRVHDCCDNDCLSAKDEDGESIIDDDDDDDGILHTDIFRQCRCVGKGEHNSSITIPHPPFRYSLRMHGASCHYTELE